MKSELGETEFRSWLSPISILRVADGQAVIAAPSRMVRDWVSMHYADRLLSLWRVENHAMRRLSIVVAGMPAGISAAPSPGQPSPANGPGLVQRPHREVSVDPLRDRAAPPVAAADSAIAVDKAQLSAALDPRFTFENFVVGKPNAFAHAAARRVAEACANPVHSVPFNPLFLYGGVGLGKTHLMHAIAWYVRKHTPSRKVIYLSAEKFMYQFIRALRFRSTIDFKEQFRSVDLLMVDDVQFISGKDSTQEEFFHTFNALVDQNRQIVISADKSPSDLEGIEERVRSRLGWGLVADLHPTTYELRLGILQSKAEQSGVKVPQKVLEYLAHKVVSNVRELEGALTRITAHTQLVRHEITLDSVQELLRDLLRANER
ncbi:MAG TPA: chromosomal replication initiator protein DnaA, partial [Stellaceae bacterium]|nr:chromosomal replication initiator protein DnaA [Stellaceae bacterium]